MEKGIVEVNSEVPQRGTPKVAQEILGHSEISMTMDIYSHVLPTMQEDARNKLNHAFQRGK